MHRISSIFGLDIGPVLRIDGENCDILHCDEKSNVCTFRKLEGNVTFQKTHEEFIKGLISKSIEPLESWKPHRNPKSERPIERTNYDNRKLPDARWRQYFVQEQLKVGPDASRSSRQAAIVAAYDAAKADENIPSKYLRRKLPSIATVYRWCSASKAGDSLFSLIPNSFRSGRKSKPYHPIYEEVIERGIENFKNTNNQRRSDAVAEITDDLVTARRNHSELANIPTPGRSAIYKRIKMLGGEFLMAIERGRITAYQKFAPPMGSYGVLRPLERVEIDITHIDRVIVDATGKTILPEAYLICMVDVCTRMVLSFEVTLTPPTSTDIRRVLRKAIMIKDPAALKRWGVKSYWPAAGLPIRIVTDNGKEFIAKATAQAFRDFLIEHERTPPRSGRSKPYIERILGTLQRIANHSASGTKRSNIRDRGERKPDDDKLQAIEIVEAEIARTICDIYHRAEHRTLKCSPLAKWEQMTKRYPVKPILDEKKLRLITQEQNIERRVTREGIHLHGLRYHSVELAEMFNRVGKAFDVLLRFDSYDLKSIHVSVPNSAKEIEVPCLERAAIGLDLKTHLLIQKETKGLSREEDREAYRKNRADYARLIRQQAGKRPSRMKPRKTDGYFNPVDLTLPLMKTTNTDVIDGYGPKAERRTIDRSSKASSRDYSKPASIDISETADLDGDDLVYEIVR